jgi:hypothetical protein
VSDPQSPNKSPGAAPHDRFCGPRWLRRSPLQVVDHLPAFVVAHGESRRHGVQPGRVAPLLRAHGASPPFQRNGARHDCAAREPAVWAHPAGPCANARSLRRASRIVASASAPPPSRMISRRACVTTRPGRPIRWNQVRRRGGSSRPTLSPICSRASLADLRHSGKRNFAARDFGLFLAPEADQNGQMVVADRAGLR